MKVFARHAPFLILSLSCLILAGSFVMEYIYGLQPCVLCLWQRYLLIPIIIVALGCYLSLPARRFNLKLIILLYILNGSIAAYNVAVEKNWVPIPSFCQAASQSADSIEALEAEIMQSRPGCNKVQFEFMGLSLATYNFLFSLLMILLSYYGIVRYKRRRFISD